MRKYFVLSIILLLLLEGVFGQSILRVMGGYNQSIFYCSQPKAKYYYYYRPYDSYTVALDYRENLSTKVKNMQLGAQIEFKRQSQFFYYEDKSTTDTFANSLRYDIHSLNFHFFPELYLGNKVKFFFSGGPVLQVFLPTKAVGITQNVSQKNSKEIKINDSKSKDIRGVALGIKVSLGIEIQLHKGLYFSFYNAYSAGLTGMQGKLSKQMKYFNCLDINVCAGLAYNLKYKTKQ